MDAGDAVAFVQDAAASLARVMQLAYWITVQRIIDAAPSRPTSNSPDSSSL